MMCPREDQVTPEENVKDGGVRSGEFSFQTAWSDDNDLTTRDSVQGRDGQPSRDGHNFGGGYAGGSRDRGNFSRPGGGARDGFQRRSAGNGERRGGFERPRRAFNSPGPGQTPHYRRPSSDGQQRSSDSGNRQFPSRDGGFRPNRRDDGFRPNRPSGGFRQNRQAGDFRPGGQSGGSQSNRRNGEFRQRYGGGFQQQRREFVPPPETDYTISFYATDEAFAPVAQRLHQSGKTYETFAIAREFLANPEHYVFVLRKNPEATSKFYYSPLDGIPFSSKEEVVGHLLRNRLEELFDVEISEGEAPAGNFPTIVLCPYTKKPIAAPNHHSYKKLLNEHYMVYIHGMPFDRFCQRLETSSAPEDIKAWQEAMRQDRKFKIRRSSLGDKQAKPGNGEEIPGEGSANPATLECAVASESNADAVEAVEEILQSLLEVREYLEKHIDDYINVTECIRVPGTSLAQIQDRALRDFIRYHLGRQQRFPLDTANGMRTKFKQNNLHAYKSGKNGISYVCTTPRKFRSRDTRLAEKLESLLDTIEKFPLSTASAVAKKIANEAFAESEVVDLLAWLVREGYVTEFENGTLLAHPHEHEPKRSQNQRFNMSGPRKKEERAADNSADMQASTDEDAADETDGDTSADM